MHTAPLAAMDFIGPAVGALVFVRRVGSATSDMTATHTRAPTAGPIAFRGLRTYRFIGVGWVIHACWDIAHHLWGNPIWPFMPSSAFGCMIFDSVIALWFLAGAPSFLRHPHA